MHQCHHLQPVYHGQLYVRIPKTKKRHKKRGRLQRKWETAAGEVVLIGIGSMYGNVWYMYRPRNKHIPPGEKEHHLQNVFKRGYVSSQEGIYMYN